MHRITMKTVHFLIQNGIFLLLVSTSVYSHEPVIRAEYVMGTILEISVYHAPKRLANIAINSAFREVRRLDDIMSHYKKNSLLSEINHESGKKWVKVNKDLFELLKTSIKFSELTDGAFDITIAPLMDFWSFVQKSRKAPILKKIKELLPLVGYKNILLNSNQHLVFLKKPKMKLDLGGIAKGYAISKVVEILNKNKIKGAKIDFGQSLYLLGASPNGKKWRIAVKNPLNKDEFLFEFRVKNMAVSTSGGYERFFIISGKKYSHILNPQNGLLINWRQSATVISPDPVTADALSTALSVMPPEKGLLLVHSLKRTQAIITRDDKTDKLNIFLSRGLRNRVKINNFHILQKGLNYNLVK